jgi:hypothetical protein
MPQDRVTGTFVSYKGNFWRWGYWPEPNRYSIQKCSETIAGDIIEFDAKTGRIRTVSVINLEPQKHYFVVLKPKRVEIIDELLETERNANVGKE